MPTVTLKVSEYRLMVYRGGTITFDLRPLWEFDGTLVFARLGIDLGDPTAPGITMRAIASGKVVDDSWSGDRPSSVEVEEFEGAPRDVLVLDPDGLMGIRPIMEVERIQAK